MARYRKKPVVVEAFQFTLAPQSHMGWPSWFREAAFKDAGAEGSVRMNDSGRWVIWTLEGEMEVTPGDYVIKGIKGEIYPCKPDIFEASYEAVEGGAL